MEMRPQHPLSSVPFLESTHSYPTSAPCVSLPWISPAFWMLVPRVIEPGACVLGKSYPAAALPVKTSCCVGCVGEGRGG